MAEDLVATAREFVVERFPDAKAAYLAGSIAAGRATASSDLDIVVVQGSDDAETFREALRRGGRLVELFAHTAATYREFWDADVASRRCTMPQMYAGGIILVSRNGFAQARQAEAARLVEAGPPALGPEALETMRYLLTDALDDLADLTDPIEVAACAAGVLEMAADLVCARAGWWVGRGKWLPRRLLEADPDQGGRLLRGFTGDRTLLLDVARDVLDGLGGPLREGYRRTWRGVIESDALRVR